MIQLKIDRNFSHIRLDRFLRKTFKEESLSVIFSILRKKKVRVNGIIGKANQILNEGDEIFIYENLKMTAQKTILHQKWSKNIKAEKVSLDIIFQNEDFLVVNKPSGMPSQPGTETKPDESLVEKLWIWGNQEQLEFKPTIAHRLDKETSGLILVALHGDTLRELTKLIREHKIQKFYYALVKGNLKKEKGTISSSLERTDCAKGSKIKINENGKQSITHYIVKKHYKGFDFLKIKLETGRMHQIRAHFASIGHPLLGDSRYGDFSLNHNLKKQLGLNRLFLHSSRLEFTWNDKTTIFESPLPKELQKILNQLEEF